MKQSVLERFEDNVLFIPFHECWDWRGYVHKKSGYIAFKAWGKTSSAHRVSYQLYKGDIPAGFEIDHLCKNTRCSRPEHLEAVTSKINNIRSNSATAVNARKTHCLNGHLLSGDNIYSNYKNKGYRQCKICARVRAKAYIARNKK